MQTWLLPRAEEVIRLLKKFFFRWLTHQLWSRMCSLQGNKKINFSFLKDDIIIDNPSCQSRFTSLLHIGFHEWKLETPCQNHFQLPSIFNYAETRLISSPTRNQCLQIVFICSTRHPRSTFGPVKMGAHYHFKVSWVIIQISNAELKWLRLPCYHIQFPSKP